MLYSFSRGWEVPVVSCSVMGQTCLDLFYSFTFNDVKEVISKIGQNCCMSLAFSYLYVFVFVCCLSKHGILVYIKVSTTQSLLEMFLLQSIFSLMSSQSDSPVLDSSNSAATWKCKYKSLKAERNSHFSTKMKRSDYVLSMT